jgi:hydantoinase/carbamoylase family amidase
MDHGDLDTAEFEALGAQLMSRLDALGAITAEPPGLTRCFATAEHRRAVALISGWMLEAGMTTELDDAGTLVGRYPGTNPDAPVILLGSHQDTVRNGGKFDGMLGIVVAIACVQALFDAGRRLPLPIEVLAFGDEEGTRFGASMFGSKAIAGCFQQTDLDLTDAEGVTLAQAMRAFGLDPRRIPSLARRPASVKAFLEVHIEQGPVLEAEHIPLGVVDSFAGISRVSVTMRGEAGHAGTLPMAKRRDALAGAAAAILAVEEMCQADHRLVGTVGTLTPSPGAINVVPESARFVVELRSANDAARREAVAATQRHLQEIADTRGLAVTAEEIYELPAAACDPSLCDQLAHAIEAEGLPVRRLSSGAGHDTMVMARLTPSAMVFLRCAGGVSHSPAESITGADAALATRVLLRTVDRIAMRGDT